MLNTPNLPTYQFTNLPIHQSVTIRGASGTTEITETTEVGPGIQKGSVRSVDSVVKRQHWSRHEAKHHSDCRRRGIDFRGARRATTPAPAAGADGGETESVARHPQAGRRPAEGAGGIQRQHLR